MRIHGCRQAQEVRRQQPAQVQGSLRGGKSGSPEATVQLGSLLSRGGGRYVGNRMSCLDTLPTVAGTTAANTTAAEPSFNEGLSLAVDRALRHLGPAARPGGAGQGVRFVLHEGNELFGWAIEPFTNGDRLAEWIKLYILSYVFGMLCRYYPSQWLSLVSEYGAPLQGPIIHRTLHAIQQHFLREFSPQIAAIAGDTYFMGPDLGIFSETMIFDDYWK